MLVNEKTFCREWKELLTAFDNDSLVRSERNLASFIESDFHEDFILSDEVTCLYELVRDECVRRVARLKPSAT